MEPALRAGLALASWNLPVALPLGRVDAGQAAGILLPMKGKLTAIIEEAPEGGYWAVCPEVPGANGQGATVKEAKESLRAAIRLIFEDRRADARRGLPREAIKTVIAV
jgi:predicted RNase H-like HicB family nuclease